MSNKTTSFFLSVIFLVSLLLTTVFFAPAYILSDSPVYTDDYSMHFSQCLSFKRFFSTSGKSWGYDPFLLAGFPRHTLADADNKAWEVLFYLLSPFTGEGLAFKLLVFSFLLSYPFMMYAAARNFTLSRGASFVASLMSIVTFHVSLAIDFVYVGMVSYAFVCFLGVYFLSLFYRLLEEFSWKKYFAVCLLGSLLLLMHILSTLTIIIPVLILYLCKLRKPSRVQHAAIVCVPLLMVLTNSYWLTVIVDFLHAKTIRPENWEFAFQINNILEPIYVYIFQQKSFYPRAIKVEGFNSTFIDVFLLLVSVYGCRLWYKKKSFVLPMTFLLSFICYFIIIFYGSRTSFLPQFQPERFTVPLNLLLIIPGSLGLYTLMQTVLRGKKAIGIVFIACLTFVLLYRPFVWPFVKIFKNDLFRLSCTFPEPLDDLLRFLQMNTTREGRILLEDSEFTRGSLVHAYYGGHYPAVFPDHLKREYLCGPRPMYPIKHSYASFTNAKLFEKKISTYSLEDLKRLFGIYNVKWVVSWTQQANDFFSRHPVFLKKLSTIDKFTIYEVLRQPTFFLKGSGLLQADYNRIALHDVVSNNGEAIIAYHWMKKLKTDPPIPLERVLVGDDPVGFIKLVDPPRDVVIYNGY